MSCEVFWFFLLLDSLLVQNWEEECCKILLWRLNGTYASCIPVPLQHSSNASLIINSTITRTSWSCCFSMGLIQRALAEDILPRLYYCHMIYVRCIPEYIFPPLNGCWEYVCCSGPERKAQSMSVPLGNAKAAWKLAKPALPSIF